eukprot:NODE_110_length_18645_cov_0.794403.p8 type:complete len:344 gc:universal NODE_110_length_18645_cov_0.794403:13524-14555(+)
MTDAKRKILTLSDLERFKASKDYEEYVSFVELASSAIIGKKLTDQFKLSQFLQEIVTLLDNIENLIKQAPPIEHDSRFGNPQFRFFYDLLGQNLVEWLHFIPKEHRIELSTYLSQSFGHRQRIDYGTGHETNFFVFLYCCYKLELILPEDLDAMILVVFQKYLMLMRNLQISYLLEPAGSHGLWGLDDYSMLPFLFGAAQLRTHKHIKPKSIHNPETVNHFFKDYMYLGCIKFINEIKTVSLKWHSPMLNDISGVKQWSKVHEGMIKMYKGEVLGKLPVMQHFLFGSFITFDGAIIEDDKAFDGHQHVYAMGQMFPDCCGMRIPSSIAASGLAYKDKKDLPFD